MCLLGKPDSLIKPAYSRNLSKSNKTKHVCGVFHLLPEATLPLFSGVAE
jgi:hypothetical protein